MQRIRSLDLARGFTVLMIAPVHTIMLYSKPAIDSSLLGYSLAFIAEWHGAQIFMLLMGISFGLKEYNSAGKMAQKTAWLMIAGYALNLCKFILPAYLHKLPGGLFRDLQLTNDKTGMVHLFLLGDILQFAALATPILFVVSKLPKANIFAMLLAFIIIFVSPFFWDLHSAGYFINYFFELSGGKPPLEYFPLLPWLVYPLAGFSIGKYLKGNKDRVFRMLAHIGITLIFTSIVLGQCGMSFPEASFYRTFPLATIQHLGFILLALSCWNWFDRNTTPNPFFKLLGCLSHNITPVYMVQWILICWLLPLFGYHDLDMLPSLLAIAITSAVTLFSSYLISRFKK